MCEGQGVQGVGAAAYEAQQVTVSERQQAPAQLQAAQGPAVRGDLGLNPGPDLRRVVGSNPRATKPFDGLRNRGRG